MTTTEIANLRATDKPPTRVFGKLLLDDLRAVMIKDCSDVSEEDRQRVIEFMSQRLVVGFSPGMSVGRTFALSTHPVDAPCQ